jgi:hypothetical protein
MTELVVNYGGGVKAKVLIPATPPVSILVHVPKGRLTQAPGLPPNVWPLVAYSRSFLPPSSGPRKRSDRSIRQFPCVPAFAVTNYRCQGQTLSNVYLAIDDQRSPSTASLYVVTEGSWTLACCASIARAPQPWLLYPHQRRARSSPSLRCNYPPSWPMVHCRAACLLADLTVNC